MNRTAWFLRRTLRRLFGSGREPFESSAAYWENRYRRGGTSGAGSYGRLARFKADVLNAFVEENQIQSVIEFGCGDGAQLALAHYPAYIGLDVSETALALCRQRFRRDLTKTFLPARPDVISGLAPADLTLSLDVIYHLVEDEVYLAYMANLFAKARRFVAIYAIDQVVPGTDAHVRHRRFSDWIASHAQDWRLFRAIPNRYSSQTAGQPKGPVSDAGFHFYARKLSAAPSRNMASASFL